MKPLGLSGGAIAKRMRENTPPGLDPSPPRFVPRNSALLASVSVERLAKSTNVLPPADASTVTKLAPVSVSGPMVSELPEALPIILNSAPVPPMASVPPSRKRLALLAAVLSSTSDAPDAMDAPPMLRAEPLAPARTVVPAAVLSEPTIVFGPVNVAVPVPIFVRLRPVSTAAIEPENDGLKLAAPLFVLIVPD